MKKAFKTPETPDEAYTRNCYHLMQKFCWTIEDIRNLPVLTYLILIEENNAEVKKYEQDMDTPKKQTKTMGKRPW